MQSISSSITRKIMHEKYLFLGTFESHTVVPPVTAQPQTRSPLLRRMRMHTRQMALTQYETDR